MRHSRKPKSIFFICYRHPDIPFASAAFVPEHSFVEDALNFKEFLTAARAYRKFVAVAFVCLVYIFLCKNIHMVCYLPQK